MIQVRIVVCKLISGLSEYHWDTLLDLVPENMRRRILDYRNRHDQQRALFGKLALRAVLRSMGFTGDILSGIVSDEFGRPSHGSCCDFNISHSGDYVLCAAIAQGRIGIDVERVAPADIHHFDSVFSLQERLEIMGADDPKIAFYKFWTQKEAIAKAIGMGLSLPIKEINPQDGAALWCGERWHLHRIELDVDHIAHFATNQDPVKIETSRLELLLRNAEGQWRYSPDIV